MSNNTNNSSSNRIDPRFFGSPSLYQQQGKSDKSTLMPPPGTTSWEDTPPPYTPSEPAESSYSSVNPSAPPLEEQQDTNPTINNYSIGTAGGFIRPSPPQPHSYPSYNQYGAISPTLRNTGDVHIPTWPWYTQPPPPPPPPPPSTVPPKKSNNSNFCEKSFKYIFYFLLICVIIRILGILDGFSSYNGCGHGASWEALPKQFTFDQSLVIRVATGSLTTGHITLKPITDKVMEEEHIGDMGLVKMSTVISPTLVNDPELSHVITNWVNGTVLELYLPEHSSSRHCINFNAVIYVPQNAVGISVEVQNARIEVVDETLQVQGLLLATSNQNIDFYPEWSGEEITLITKNSNIELHKSMTVQKSIIATTTNGNIRVRAPIKAGNYAGFITTNKPIDIDTFAQADALQVATSNAKIIVKEVHARAIQLKTTNGRIQVDHAQVDELVNIQTSNDPVTVHIDKGLQDGELLVRTSNGEATVYMPWDHEGSFDLNTSSHSKVSIVDPLGWSLLRSKDNHVTGQRFSPNTIDHHRKGYIQVITSNARAHLEFAAAKEEE